ncbi:hypothetical protein D3C77_573620 [compost metagenome]
MLQEIHAYRCPYCGEPAEALLDLSVDDQDYVEDCPVCCQPIRFVLRRDGQRWQLDLYREDD